MVKSSQQMRKSLETKVGPGLMSPRKKMATGKLSRFGKTARGK